MRLWRKLPRLIPQRLSMNALKKSDIFQLAHLYTLSSGLHRAPVAC